MIKSFVIFSLLICFTPAFALDRCQDYIADIRIQHWKYFGLNYPYWYGIGQAKQESNCRANVTAFDAGMGLTQFMPATWKDVESHIGHLDPYNPEHSIRAQAFYMKKLHKQNWDGALWLTYQAYNGGWKLLKREAERAGYVDHELMYLVCARKVLKLKSGRLLDLCDVNYDYSKRVHKYGQTYKTFDDKYKYW